MKKLYVLAALLMATTAAHAGNSISFEVEGHKIRIEVPKNCDSLSCIQISAPSLSGSGFGFKGITSKRLGDDNDVAVNSDAPAPKSAPAPVDQQAAPQPSVPPANSAAPASTVVASTATAPAIGRDAPISSIYGRACHVAARPVAAAPVEAPATPLVDVADGAGEFPGLPFVRGVRGWARGGVNCIQNAAAHFRGRLARERDRENLLGMFDRRQQAQVTLRQ